MEPPWSFDPNRDAGGQRVFPLYQQYFPASAAELAAALQLSLQRIFSASENFVTVLGQNYPALDKIAIDLSGAKVKATPAPPSLPTGAKQPALSAAKFEVNASSLSLGTASLDLKLDAQNVALDQDKDRDGNIILLLQRAERGQIEVAILQKDLQAIVGEVAKTQAAKHGVAIDEVSLTLRSLGPRALAGEVALQARKLFLRATIKISGQIEVDDQLVAHISHLKCAGEGAIASLACGVLEPQLQKLQNRPFALIALPLGEVKIHDVRVGVAEKIYLTAEFGSGDRKV